MSKKIRVELTTEELGLLLLGLGNGIGDDALENLGLSKSEMALMGKVANRLHKLHNGTAPYLENSTDY